MNYVLYYDDERTGQLRYAHKALGDGDWEYTYDPKRAGVLDFSQLQRWVALHGRKAGWLLTE